MHVKMFYHTFASGYIAGRESAETGRVHRVPIASPLPLRVAKTGKNNLNEEITPLVHTGISERF
jgi:hypothetical protein